MRFAASQPLGHSDPWPGAGSVARALPVAVSLAVLLGLLLGFTTMHQNHQAHHAVVAAAPVDHAARSTTAHLLHEGMGGHGAHHAVSQPQQATVAAASGNGSMDKSKDTGSTDEPKHLALKLCLAVLLLGGLALRVAIAARKFIRLAAAGTSLVAVAAAIMGVRPRSSSPPGSAIITRLCVLRQ